jgi:autotransporter-associated beta strand protein
MNAFRLRFTLLLRVGAAVILMAIITPNVSHAVLTYNIGGSWDTTDRQNAAAAAMQLVCNRFNAYGDCGNYNIYVYYNSGIPTAQSSYLGSIGFGGTWPAERVAEHEACHYLGSGTYSAWTTYMIDGRWNGPAVTAIMQQLYGIGSRLSGDSNSNPIHFWPYGLNYDSEGSETNKESCVAILHAMRADMGFSDTIYKSTATTVNLTASDPVGASSFDYSAGWSDAFFAHSGANYYTGNYAIRTPASAYGFNFAGDSLTVNNSGDASQGLFYKGSGSTGVISFKNLIFNGGSTHHYSGTSDVFQLGGKVTIASSATFNSEQGNTNILADVTGSGTLNIGTTNTYYVRMCSSNNTFIGNINVAGRFELANGANQRFAIGANGVNNAITGSSANQVLLNGVFKFDMTNAATNIGNSWTLVTAANTTYGSTFGVSGFARVNGIWRDYLGGLTYSESTNALTVVAKSSTTAWSGNSSANWSGGANWNAAQPANGDSLVFAAAGAAGTTLTDDLMTSSTYAVSGLTFASAAPAYTINAGTTGTNGFTLAGSIVNSSTNLQTINDNIYLPRATPATPRGAPNTLTIATTAGGGDVAIGGNISGIGGIDKTGSGTLTLSGSNTYTGSTVVDAGTLLLSGTLTGGSPLRVNTGGVLVLSGQVSSTSTLAVGGGTFTYSNPGATTQTLAGLTVTPGAATISNASSGTLALGAITRNTGGTIDFATMAGAVTTTASNTNGILGAWAFVGSGASTLYAYSNGGTIAGYTGATVESGTASLGGIPSGDTSTVNYTITSSGTFAAMGITRSVNTINYAGSGSATQPGANNTVLTINGLMNTGSGTLTIGGSPKIWVTIGSNLDLVVATMTGDIVLNNSVEDTSVGYGSPSALTKVGTGKLTLNGANTYSGITTIGAGTLQIGSGSSGASLVSSVINDYGALIFNHSDSLTYGGTISGTGNVSKVGAGTLTLQGNNIYAGTTTLTAGRLVLSGSNSTSGNVVISNGTILQLVANSGNSTTVGGVLSSSALGNNSPSGTTGFQLGGGTSGSVGIELRGDISAAFANTTTGNAGNVTLNFNVNNVAAVSGSGQQSQTLTFAPASETSRNNGNGLTTYNTTINASGANGYSLAIGKITSAGSLLTINANTANIRIGSIDETDSTTLTFGGSYNSLVSGSIGNSGGTLSLNKTGSGTLTLQGASTYAGLTNINQGQLILDGGDLSDLSTVNVASGASLQVISGTPTLGSIAGAGSTSVLGYGTVLTAASLNQSSITLGAGATLVIAAIPGGPSSAREIQSVPEPQMVVMLLAALAVALIVRRRMR